MVTRRSLSVALALVVVLVALGIAVCCPRAHACSIKTAPNKFIVNSAPGVDVPDPPALKLVGFTLERSEHAPPGNGDCKDVGSLTIKLAPADGSSWPASVGVILTLVSGTFPAAFRIPTYALQTGDGSLAFAGGDDPSQSIDFTVQATAVNLSGAQSAPIEIHIVGDAEASSGCAVAGAHGRSAALPFMLALSALILARPKRRPKCSHQRRAREG